MPNLFIKKGIRRIQNVSDIWERDIRIIECLVQNESAYSGRFPKSVRKGLANPLVI